MTSRPFTSTRGLRAVLGLALAAALAGCAHLPWSRHGADAPRAASAALHSAPGSGAPAGVSAALEPHALAARHLSADSLALAETELRALLSRDPGDAAALSLLSKLLYRAGRHDEAVALLEPALAPPAAFPDDARRALQAGLALHEDALGRTTAARAAIAAAGGAVSSAAVFVTLRGDAPDSAASMAGEALHRDGRSAVNLNNYGITRLRAGDLDGARQAFTRAIDRDASLPGPYYNLAILEKFYRYDDTAAARWFASYWDRSHDDPDSLRAAFPANLATVPQPAGGRP